MKNHVAVFFAVFTLLCMVGSSNKSYAEEDQHEQSYQVNDTLMVIEQLQDDDTNEVEMVMILQNGPSTLLISNIDDTGFDVACFDCKLQQVAWVELEMTDLNEGDSYQKTAFNDFKEFAIEYGLAGSYRGFGCPVSRTKCHKHCRSVKKPNGKRKFSGGYCRDGKKFWEIRTICQCYY